ncbi:hypothetical protein ALC62_03522 [Cyphomyrmex costatus]|uniref:Uncharacterized protein n=1 Tax=Cyphomyrmex costatus TaxID=456900 RepID=A0A151ILM4_9HYME|nr:hypothetical protein ALC62_03522 [Cyphomyrmex costatus]
MLRCVDAAWWRRSQVRRDGSTNSRGHSTCDDATAEGKRGERDGDKKKSSEKPTDDQRGTGQHDGAWNALSSDTRDSRLSA